MSTNPYSDPYSSQQHSPEAYGPLKPGAVTAVSVLAIVLGVLGLLTVCGGGVGLIANTALQGMMTVPPNATPMQKAQIELNQEIMGLTQRYLPLTLVFLGAQLVLAPMLIYGGVKTLRMDHAGRRFLIYTFLALIAFEVIRTAFQFYLQLQMLPLYDEMAMRVAREGGGTGEDEMILRFTKGATMFGLVAALVWPAVKIVLYALSSRYLALPKTIEAFDRFAAAKPSQV